MAFDHPRSANAVNDERLMRACLAIKPGQKTEQEHEMTWEADSLMQELALALVEDYQKNKKLRVVRTKGK